MLEGFRGNGLGMMVVDVQGMVVASGEMQRGKKKKKWNGEKKLM